MRTAQRRTPMLWVLPTLILLSFLGWVWWRHNADLDAIEARQLAWSTLGHLAVEHLNLTAICTLIVIATAIPLGVLITRPGARRAAPVVVGIANAGQAAPVIGLIVLLAMWIGFGTRTAIIALSLYAFLPVLQNTVVGLNGVDRTLVEAARGLGMSRAATLFRIELPMAVPVIMSGVRTALVLLVGTASFATFIDAGGLGTPIQTGIALFRNRILFSGAILVALLALTVEWLGQLLEHVARPKGL